MLRTEWRMLRSEHGPVMAGCLTVAAAGCIAVVLAYDWPHFLSVVCAPDFGSARPVRDASPAMNCWLGCGSPCFIGLRNPSSKLRTGKAYLFPVLVDFRNYVLLCIGLSAGTNTQQLFDVVHWDSSDDPFPEEVKDYDQQEVCHDDGECHSS